MVLSTVTILPVAVSAVDDPKTFTFKGKTVSYTGATLTWSGSTAGAGDAILTFTDTTNAGTLTLPQGEFIVDYLVVVGGGSGGGGGSKSDGNGGNNIANGGGGSGQIASKVFGNGGVGQKQTGETVKIPASKASVFKAGKDLKDSVNK